MERLKQAVVRLAAAPALASQKQSLPLLELTLSPVLSLGAIVFSCLRQLRILLYRWRLLRQHRLPLPVVAVGNLTWGGTGKTPMVEFLARRFIGAGIRPLVLTRGYGGGDEARLLATHLLPDGDVGCGGDRASVCNQILREQGVLSREELQKLANNWQTLRDVDPGNLSCPDEGRHRIGVVILDDGLQHWGLVKDLEVVMVNAISLWGNGCTVPRGPLREPVQELRRADLVVIHHADLIPACRLESIRALVKTGALILCSQMVPKYFSTQPHGKGVHCQGNMVVSLDRVKGEVILCVSGIGCPESLTLVLKQLGALQVEEMTFSDHHQFTQDDVCQMAKEVSILQGRFRRPVLLVITEKDYMRDPHALAGLRTAEVLVLHSTLKIMDEAMSSSQLDDMLVRVICWPLQEQGFPACHMPSRHLNRRALVPA